MKICILTSGHEVFDSRIYYKEILSLKKIYSDIYIIAPGDNDFITEDGIHVLSFEKRRAWHDRFRPMKEMYRLALGVKADIYHAHEPDSYQVAVKLKKHLGSKIIYDSHEYHPESFADHFRHGKALIRKSVYLYEKHLAQKADYIITVNNLLVDKFKKYNEKVMLIPNYPIFLDKEVHKEFSEKPTFVYVGGLSEERGILKILESIKLVKEKYTYIIVGAFWSEGFKNTVYKYVDENLKDQEIIFTGAIPHEQVASYLKDAVGGLVLLQPTSWRYVNSEPIKIFEYMMNKVPIIASDFPMMNSIVNQCKSGMLVKPDDVKEISNAIEWLAGHQEEAKAMGENGYINTKKAYNWSVLEPRLLQVYSELIGD